MIDHGCGVITVSEYNKEKFRELLKEFHQTRDYKNSSNGFSANVFQE